MTGVPALVTLHVWGVRARGVPAAVLRMGVDRPRLHRVPGLRFAKLLGTGSGRTFTVRDADPRHWGLLACWADPDAAAVFEHGEVAGGWQRLSEERLRVALRPLTSRGRWSRREPFGDPRPSPYEGQVAVLTRARLAPRKALAFWRAVPPVAADLHRSPGLRLALALGEAPLGKQATFSVWDSPTAMTDFAHRRREHAEAVRRTATEGWYAEELFARLAVLEVEGTYQGRTP